MSPRSGAMDAERQAQSRPHLIREKGGKRMARDIGEL